MTCREVERFWEDRLDAAIAGAPPAVAEGLPPELEAHLGRCPRCRARSAGLATLGRSIGALGPAPSPSPGLSARILAAVEADRAPRTPPIRRMPAGFRAAAAAAAVLVGLAGLRALWPPIAPGPGPGPGPAPAPGAIGALLAEPPRPLTEAVAEAAEATVAIARRTSEPAARIGREVFGSPPAGPAEEEPPGPGPAGSAMPDRVVRLIGDHLGAGVRPLSEPTRSAFSFLLPSFPSVDEAPPADRGA